MARSLPTENTKTTTVLWLTGLSGAGKTTLADQVARDLRAAGQACFVLDGDNVRKGLSQDLGFSDADRTENIRRVAEVAKLMRDAGLTVIVALISPFRAERDAARTSIGNDHFIEIYLDTPLAVAEQRDVKGLYKKARSGELKNFTGIDSPYEPPLAPALTIHTETETPQQSAARVMQVLNVKGNR
ncbi:adenylyl-sulfate kinase [Pseudohongiella sp.]|uniref:adenylyl-sulfate kinase n=1 Tax=marine sediment metagenome TaxID=412755 RepID=A0A0F9WHA8_9ZZZZ|nr:adenylyl-sulfate kinase [Pseudohongiella sp.]